MSNFYTILVPCFNAEDFILQTIQSLLDQTNTSGDILLINDGSSDKTSEIIEKAIKNCSNVKLISYKNNRGKAIVLNEIFSEIQSKYIILQDADDIAHPTRIERQIAFMESRPKIGCSSSFIRYINTDGRVLGKGVLDLTSKEKLEAYLSSNEPFGLFCPAVILRRKVFENPSLRFRQQFWPADDIDLWNRIAESEWDVRAQPEFLVDYRIHGASAVTSNFWKTREKFEFVRACLRARRQNHSEPTWEEFLRIRETRSLFTKMNDFRKTGAKAFYRTAGFHWGEGKRTLALMEMGIASLLQPGYVLPRLRSQI